MNCGKQALVNLAQCDPIQYTQNADSATSSGIGLITHERCSRRTREKRAWAGKSLSMVQLPLPSVSHCSALVTVGHNCVKGWVSARGAIFGVISWKLRSLSPTFHINQFQKILTIRILGERLPHVAQLSNVNVAHAVGNFLNTSDPPALPLLQEVHEFRGLL